MNWTPLEFILEQMYWFPGTERGGLSFYRGRGQCFVLPKSHTRDTWEHLPVKDTAEDLNVEKYLLFILYFWLLVFRMWILVQRSAQLIWLIWQWLVLRKADVGQDFSFYCCLTQKFVCGMTCVWDAGRSSPLSSIEMYV